MLINLYHAKYLGEKGKDALIDLLLNPDKRDLDKDMINSLIITKHDIDKVKRSKARRNKCEG